MREWVEIWCVCVGVMVVMLVFEEDMLRLFCGMCLKVEDVWRINKLSMKKVIAF